MRICVVHDFPFHFVVWEGEIVVGLSSLNYSDLKVSQGTGSYSSHVIVQEKSTGDFLLILQNQSISNIDDNDFSAI